ncbi:hypothetical protein POSPLADRAFT_1066951 [Postia placenta MAD-698-R-SB12]|uniref:Bud22 domain-containing protein n=1 Tax=Postia placenta MAD-698-R-SB12 TaxID=670580 RepID=A0A1X6MUA5_9APHY|nr:hypothetical protein POSPLADRAFT_1066951 [Postia placenta MAD-698-R-SB12]OSX59840.1 hypothetical protein POSPLADRAFT_1066951 [Postia placenta MAD-698-R-SB12]
MASVTEQRGTKRKRGAVAKEEDLSVKLTRKLYHAAKEMRKVAKKEKTFETQKIVKKLKTLRAKDPEGNAKMILDFESQLEVIKVHTPIRYSVSFRVLTMDQHLDHEPIANLALKTKLNKDRLLLQNEHMQTAISTELSPNLLTSADPGTAARKVQDRLLSSKTLAVEVLSVLTALKEMVDPSLRKGPEQAPDAEGSDDEPPSKVKKAKAPSRPVGGSGDEHEGGDESTAPEVDAAGWESGTVRGDDDDDGWESGSVDDANPRGQSIAGGADSDGSEADDSGNEDENSDDEEDDDDDDDDVDGGDNAAVAIASATKRASQQAEKGKKVALPAKDTKGKSKATAESTFLPSLSVGFTRGDSDASDLSDEEVKVADMRKNRRGQRARRAIWEKKYGGNANHVKKEREAMAQEPRNQRRADPHGRNRTHPPGGSRKGGPPSAFRAPPSDKGWMKKGEVPNVPSHASVPPKAKSKDDKPLHPSWEAKKRLNEKLKPVILPPQGKKIIFS